MQGGAPLDLDAFAALPDGLRSAAIDADSRGAADAAIALGDECERRAGGSPASALELGEALAAATRGLGLAVAEARALRATIAALAYLGRPQDALRRADESVAAAISRGGDGLANRIEAARARVASLHALAILGRTDDALATGAEARDALLAAGRPDLAARAELNLANVHKFRGEREDALAALGRALSGVPEEDVAARGTIENARGEILFQLDRFGDAHAAFARAAALLAPLPMARAVVAGNRADLFAREGRLGDALREFDDAIGLVREHAPGHHARLLLEQAEAFAILGAWRETLAATDAALAIAVPRGLAGEAVRARLMRGRALAAASRGRTGAESAREGTRGEARAEAMRAIEAATATGDRRVARSAALLASELALGEGDASDALVLAREAADDASPLESAMAAVREARARLALGDPDGALGCARAGRAQASSLGVAVVEIDAAAAEADCERALGRVSAAIDALSHAVARTEELRGTLAAERLRAAFASSRLRVYEDLALDLLENAVGSDDRSGIERAFATVERARSRALLDLVLRAIGRAPSDGAPPVETDAGDGERGPRQATDAPAGDADRERGLDAELATLRARLSALHAAVDRDDGAVGERRGVTPARLREMREVERSIDDLLARGATRRGIGSLLAEPLGARDVLGALGEGDAIISYFTAGDELLAFAGIHGSIHAERSIASAGELAPLVEKFLFLLRAGTRGEPSSRAPRALDAVSRALHDVLVAPILESVPALGRARRLVIVPFGALHALPFAALRDGRATLLDRFELQLAPSASIACAPRDVTDATSAAQRDAGDDVLVVGVADADAPLIADETREIAAIATGARVLAGPHATRSSIRRGVRRARTIHLACHGRFVPSLPMASGLRLADGWMPVRELVDLELQADLVYLSGCETGRVAVEAGDELSGITRAFLAAGARRLVTTLWPVRDSVAIGVARRFHLEIREGARPSSALRTAMLASRENTPHPSWWAPYVVTGAL